MRPASPLRPAGFLAVALGILLGPCESAAQPARSGVLVATTQGRTLWIRPVNDSIEIEEIPAILVPRKTGFWAVTTITTIRKDTEMSEAWEREWLSSEEILFIQPVEMEPSVDLPAGTRVASNKEDLTPCDSVWHSIHHVNPRYVFFGRSHSSDCGMHPNVEFELYALPIDGFARRRLEISEAFGADAWEAFDQGVREGVKQRAKEVGKESFPEKTDERNWTIERGQGRWVVGGWAATHRLEGYGFDFDISLTPTKDQVGHDELAVPWESIQRAVPDAYDAFTSPSRDLLVVLRWEEMLAFRLPDWRPEKPAARLKLYAPPYRNFPPEKATMIEWALGRNVARWNAELLRLKPRFEKKAKSRAH